MPTPAAAERSTPTPQPANARPQPALQRSQLLMSGAIDGDPSVAAHAAAFLRTWRRSGFIFTAGTFPPSRKVGGEPPPIAKGASARPSTTPDAVTPSVV